MSEAKIVHVFEEAQRSESTHRNEAKKLLHLINTTETTDCLVKKIITNCYDKILICSKQEKVVDRIMKFFCKFVAVTNDQHLFDFMNYLITRTSCSDKVVRYRACQSICMIISAMGENAEIDDALWDMISTCLVVRLRDKHPAVRLWALKGLKEFQDPSNSSDVITQEFIRLMESDTSKEVRVAAIQTIVLTTSSLFSVLHRLRDIKQDVRLACIQRLSEIEAVQLQKVQLSLFVKYGLGDRDETVRAAAMSLVVKWMQTLKFNIPKLLQLVGLRSHRQEVDMLAWSIIHECQKESIQSGPLQSAVMRGMEVDWEECGFSDLLASELLWLLARCMYFHRTLPRAQACDRTESLLPDTVILCRLLLDGATALQSGLVQGSTGMALLGMECLLRLTAYADTSDVAGCQQLISVCRAMIEDVEFCDDLVDSVLVAYSKAISTVSGRTSVSVLVQELVEVAQKVWPCTIAESDSVREDEEERRVLSQIRSLHIIAWCVQNHTAAEHRKQESFTDPLVPMVLEALQQPCEELRSFALRVLGLLGISSARHCAAFAGIVLQVANATQEDTFIRCQAIESLADMAMVHTAELISEDTLVRLLLILMDCGDCIIQRVAAEASAKLLFSGRIVKSPALFAQLVKVFFHPFESNDEADENCTAEKGSAAYLDQILSVFFPAFFSAGGGRGDIALHSVPLLIADICMLVRDEFIPSMPIVQMMEHILGWCEFLPNDSGDSTDTTCTRIQRGLKIQICASVLKEMLVLQSNKSSHKALLKELSKVLVLLTPCESWVFSHAVGQELIKTLITLKRQCRLDKVSAKSVDKLHTSCRDTVKNFSSEVTEETDEEKSDMHPINPFWSLAPGLADMVDAASDDESVLGSASSDDDDFEEADNNAEVEQPVRTRISRSSKVQAQSRISIQLSDENAENAKRTTISVKDEPHDDIYSEGNNAYESLL